MSNKKPSKKKQVFKYTLLAILILVILTVLGFYNGWISNRYLATIGLDRQNVQRENFEHNKSYVHGMVEDLADHKLEYERAKDETEKKAIRTFIVEKYSNFDENLIESNSLRAFLREMMDGGN